MLLSFLTYTGSLSLIQFGPFIQQTFLEPAMWKHCCRPWGHSSEQTKILCPYGAFLSILKLMILYIWDGCLRESSHLFYSSKTISVPAQEKHWRREEAISKEEVAASRNVRCRRPPGSGQHKDCHPHQSAGLLDPERNLPTARRPQCWLPRWGQPPAALQAPLPTSQVSSPVGFQGGPHSTSAQQKQVPGSTPGSGNWNGEMDSGCLGPLHQAA